MDLKKLMEVIHDSSSDFSSEVETSSTSSSDSEDEIKILLEMQDDAEQLPIKKARVLSFEEGTEAPFKRTKVLSFDEDPEEPLRKTGVSSFEEDTVANYTDAEFLSHFRMSRNLASSIIDDMIRANVVPTHIFGRKKITAKKAFLLTLWYLAKQETFRQISNRWEVSQSSAYRALQRVTDYLVSLAPSHIVWPTGSKVDVIQNSFKHKTQISGIVGVIGNAHIPIRKPSKEGDIYVNSARQNTIQLQGVVDHEMLFTDIYCGEPGSLQDARVLIKSPLYQKVTRNELVFEKNTFLLGDTIYPNLSWLISPVKDTGTLSEHEFNFKHSATRIVVENAFTLLKGRFRRLIKFDNYSNLELIINCVISACVLHNICIRKDELNIEMCMEENDFFIDDKFDDVRSSDTENFQ